MARPILTRPDIQVFAEIAAIDQMVTRAIERKLPPGLGRAQFNLLMRLAFTDDQSPGDLATYLVLTKGAVTHLLARLESQGLIALRTDADDSRRKKVRLTEGGVHILAESGAGLRDLSAILRAALPTEAFQQTLPLLSALRAHLSEQI
jgi:DNA-binding MarR family transcriptional regulator